MTQATVQSVHYVAMHSQVAKTCKTDNFEAVSCDVI